MTAGVDIFVLPGGYEEVSEALLDLVASGKLPMRRVNRAVSRMLHLKSSLDLFQVRRRCSRSVIGWLSTVRCQTVRQRCASVASAQNSTVWYHMSWESLRNFMGGMVPVVMATQTVLYVCYDDM